MSNNYTYSPRANPMSSSSMFFHTPNNDFTKSSGYGSTNSTFNPYSVKKEFNPDPVEEPKIPSFPKALASQSMIDMNSTSTTRRAAFGALDSMARKVTPDFQDDTIHEKKPGDSYNHGQDNALQGNTNSYQNGLKKFSTNYTGL